MANDLTMAEIERLAPFTPQAFYYHHIFYDLFLSRIVGEKDWTWAVYDEGSLVARGVESSADVAKLRAIRAAGRYRETGVVNV